MSARRGGGRVSTRRRLPPRMLRRLILSALLGIALGAAAWYLGMDAPHAIGLGAAAFALCACLSALGEAADVVWAVPAPEPRPGARRDLVQLGWSLGSRGGRASPEGVRRVRSVAERALSLQGLDLEDRTADERLEGLLGADGLRLLRRGTGVAPPRTAEVAAVLARLEALAASVDPQIAAPPIAAPPIAAPPSAAPPSAAPPNARPRGASTTPAPTHKEPHRAR
ncbi:hypothetical protein [Leifsonia shinshuensis]|uniref:hypothetical protein n=1 Tax=Leifsonia shinshuensis TaxID=150026 RepID=UPI00285889E7|nr:hypothetical protein [Leifsonia shinshuensis]MDR6970669.1 hypothetical protein [Leifsonia shinshuensis]